MCNTLYTPYNQWTLTHVIFFCYVIHIHPRPVRLHKCRFAATPAQYVGSGSMRNLCGLGKTYLISAGRRIWLTFILRTSCVNLWCLLVLYILNEMTVTRWPMAFNILFPNLTRKTPARSSSFIVLFVACVWRSTQAVLFYILLKYIYHCFHHKIPDENDHIPNSRYNNKNWISFY